MIDSTYPCPAWATISKGGLVRIWCYGRPPFNVPGQTLQCVCVTNPRRPNKAYGARARGSIGRQEDSNSKQARSKQRISNQHSNPNRKGPQTSGTCLMLVTNLDRLQCVHATQPSPTTNQLHLRSEGLS